MVEPFAGGLVHETLTAALLLVCDAVTPTGAPGAAVVSWLVSLVPELEPTEFVATAVSVYFTPLTTFEMLHELVPKATVQLRVVWSVAVAVMVYPMMLEPLLSVGGVQRN